MKDAMDTVKLYGMYAKENLDKASQSFQSGFKKIGDGIHTAKERITGALEVMAKAFVVLGGTIALISWQGSKYAEDLWRAWVDASGKIAASGKDLDKFSSSLINMATKSKFGMIEVANAAKLASSFNLDEVKSLDAVSAAMQYSMATGDDLTTSINGIARAMMVFRDKNLTGKEAADILAKANIDSRVSAEDMEMTLRALGPITNKLKWDFKDVVAILSVFKDNNIEGGRAMMGLANIMNDILDPTSVLGKEIAKTGIGIKDSAGKVKDIISLFRDLKSAGSDTSLIFNHLSAIIGPGLSNVVEKGTGALNTYIKSFSNVDGYAKELATTFEKTLPGAFGFFVARMKDLPVVMSFFLKDALTNLFTPMQKALGDLSAMIDKSGFAKKIDSALSPTFKRIGEWISTIINKWTLFISKLTAEDIAKAIAKVEAYLKNLGETLKKIFSGINVAELFKGLVSAFMMLVAIIGRLGTMFSNLPDWAKNLVILGAAFVLLGGPAIIGGLALLVTGLFKVGAAIGAIKAAGGLAFLSKLGLPGLVVAGGLGMGLAAGKAIETFGPGISQNINKATHQYKPNGPTLEFGNFGGNKGGGLMSPEERAAFENKGGQPGTEKIKAALEEAMKMETNFAAALDAEFGNMGMDAETLNKAIETTRGEIKDGTKNFMATIDKQGNTLVSLSNATIDMMTTLDARNRYLQARLDALEKRIASIRITQVVRQKGL